MTPLERDAFGKDAVYYTEGGVVLDPRKAGSSRFDRDALSDYLELGYVPAPFTLWSGVHKLLAGHRLREGRVERWREAPVPSTSSVRPSRIAVRARLEQAVASASGTILLERDLPSFALLALLTRKRGKQHTISFGSDPLIARVAERFRSDHHELSTEPDLSEIRRAAEPLADPLLALLPRAPRPLLTAAGGNELFAGHARYLRAAKMVHSHRAARAADLLRTIAPAQHKGRLQRAASTLGSRGAPRARALVEIFSLDERRALLGAHARSADGPPMNFTGADAAIAFDLEVALAEGVLAVQRAAGDVAAPFLEEKLAATVVPPLARHKLGRAHGNRLLREAVADLLPRDALTPLPRPPLPVGAWLRGSLRPLLHDLVAAPTARIRHLLDPRAVDLVLRHSLAPRGDPRQAWTLFVLELWLREQRR